MIYVVFRRTASNCRKYSAYYQYHKFFLRKITIFQCFRRDFAFLCPKTAYFLYLCGRFMRPIVIMFRIPKVTKYLLLANIAIYLLSAVFSTRSMGGADFNAVFGLHYFLAPDFRVYQLLTYMFMHGGFVHLFFNMFALWMFGCVVENALGTQRYIVFYLVCGVGAGLFQEAAQTGEFIMMCNEQIPGFSMADLMTVARNSADQLNLWTTVGASGAIYAILLGFGIIFPDQRIFIFPLPIPLKAKWLVIFYAAIELFSALSTTSDGVAHVAHLGGMLIGWLLIRYWKRHPFGFGGGYGKRNFFENMCVNWERRREARRRKKDDGFTSYTDINTEEKRADWEYNASRAAKQKEIDAILDKIRKSGYDSLSTEEKQKLFDNSSD